MKRNTLLIVVVAIAAIFMFFNPLKLLRGNTDAVAKPATDKATVASLLTYAQGSWRSPEDYVVAAFKTHDIVFLGEFYKIRQNVMLVHDLIPLLYRAGVRNLGIEYALSDDQKDIDALLNAPQWDEAKARAITFSWLVTWGYSEYIDLYQAAWQVNRGLPAGAKPFRIVGLSPRQNWEFLKSEKDMSDPAVVARIFANGEPEAHIAQVIDRELVQKGEKSLVYVGTQHAFTRFRSAAYAKNAATVKLSDTRRAGNIVFDRIGNRAFSISLHAPWPDTRSGSSGLAYAAEGAIDALISVLPPDRRNGGWDLEGTPLGALPVTTGSYAEDAKGLTLSGVFDGYVIQGPIAEYRAVTPIPDFVRPQDAERAARDFPGVKSGTMTVEEVNKVIVEDTLTIEKLLAQFK
jgi:hypothetical protein